MCRLCIYISYRAFLKTAAGLKQSSANILKKEGGGSGEYLSVADKIYLMEDFRIFDATVKAKEISLAEGGKAENAIPSDWEQHRILCSDGFSSYPQNSGSKRLLVSDRGLSVLGMSK